MDINNCASYVSELIQLSTEYVEGYSMSDTLQVVFNV